MITRALTIDARPLAANLVIDTFQYLGLTGASTHGQRRTAVEQALAGKPATAETIRAAARGAGADLETVNADIHASEEYRRAMIPVFTKRALEAALARG